MEKRGRKIGGGQENAARMTRCFENSSHFAAREGREGMTPPCTVRSQNGTNVSKLRISTLYKYIVLIFRLNRIHKEITWGSVINFPCS